MWCLVCMFIVQDVSNIDAAVTNEKKIKSIDLNEIHSVFFCLHNNKYMEKNIFYMLTTKEINSTLNNIVADAFVQQKCAYNWSHSFRCCQM